MTTDEVTVQSIASLLLGSEDKLASRRSHNWDFPQPVHEHMIKDAVGSVY